MSHTVKVKKQHICTVQYLVAILEPLFWNSLIQRRQLSKLSAANSAANFIQNLTWVLKKQLSFR